MKFTKRNNNMHLVLLILFTLVFYSSQIMAQDNDTQQMLEQVRQLQQQVPVTPVPVANPPAVIVQTPPSVVVQSGSAVVAAPVPTIVVAQTPPPAPIPPPIILPPAPPPPVVRPRIYPPPSRYFEAPFDDQQLRQSIPEKTVQNQAFTGTVRGLLPMTPQQIHRLKQLYEAAQYAAAAPAGVPPRPTATSIYVNLSPGATPPVIRLSQGFVSSLVFLDASGAAWPIEAYDIGNPNAFDIQWDKKDNVLMIQAKSLYTYGNLAVRLRELNTPIMLTLIPGQEIVDYRIDITVPGYGPLAQALPISTGLPGPASSLLLNILQGIPPSGSQQLIVEGGVGEAWLLKDKIFLRTTYTLLSPGWIATMSSADGTHAYKLQQAPYLLLAQNGKVINVKIEGF